MKRVFITFALAAMSLFASQTFAATAACEKSAEEKKLAGAAKTAHIKKCESDATAAAPVVSAACQKSAEDKKLAGAAKTSHLKKCMADAGAKK